MKKFFLILIVLNVAIYANSLKGQFVSDDIQGILNNPQVLNYSTALNGAHRHIQYLVWGLSLKYFGTTPIPMHVFALFLHIINVILVYLIISKVFDNKTAVIASLLYSVHPVNTESVDWITSTIYLFVAFFLFSITLAFTIYKQKKEPVYLYIAYGLFATAVIFTDNYWNYIIPPFLIVYDQLILEKGFSLKGIKAIAPILITAIVLFGVTYASTVSGRINFVDTGTNTPFLTRLPYSIYMHGELLTFPKNLTLYHEGEIITQQKYQLMIAISILIGMSLPYIFYKSRKIAGLILLSYAAVLPIFSPVQVSWFIADRYLYVPAAMFCTVVAIGLIKLDNYKKIKHLTIIATFILFAAYSTRTIIRNSEWQTPKKLWLATERVGPNSPRVHNNLGDVYANEKDYESSIWHFNKAIELQPNYADAIHNLGNTYLQMGDLDNAEKYLLLSLEKNPNLYPATYKLGLIAYNKGNIDEAKGWFEQTLTINPGNNYAMQALDFIKAQTEPATK